MKPSRYFLYFKHSRPEHFNAKKFSIAVQISKDFIGEFLCSRNFAIPDFYIYRFCFWVYRYF